MRPKLVLFAIVIFVTAVASLSMLRPSIKANGPTQNAAPEERVVPLKATPDSQPHAKPVDAKNLALNSTTNAAPNPESHALAVEKRSEELMALAMKDDAASLTTILADLDNADPEIRAAALQATIQFGSRDAIPRLMEAAQKTEDRQERRALEDAVEYLKLPSLTEVRQERHQLVNH